MRAKTSPSLAFAPYGEASLSPRVLTSPSSSPFQVSTSLTKLPLPLCPLGHRLVEIRAAQRTFEGAYMRTGIGMFSLALIILRIFTEEFYAIGALFAAYGTTVLVVSMYRRYQGHRQFFVSESEDGVAHRKFRTSGDTITLLTILTLCAYVVLFFLTLRLADQS